MQHISKSNYEDVKDYSIPTASIEIRLGDIRKNQRNAIAFLVKTPAFESLVRKSGKEEKIEKALREASGILAAAVEEVINGN